MAAGAVGQRRGAVATTPAREFSAREWERVLHPRVRGSRSPPSSQFLLHVLPCPSLCPPGPAVPLHVSRRPRGSAPAASGSAHRRHIRTKRGGFGEGAWHRCVGGGAYLSAGFAAGIGRGGHVTQLRGCHVTAAGRPPPPRAP